MKFYLHASVFENIEALDICFDKTTEPSIFPAIEDGPLSRILVLGIYNERLLLNLRKSNAPDGLTVTTVKACAATPLHVFS